MAAVLSSPPPVGGIPSLQAASSCGRPAEGQWAFGIRPLGCVEENEEGSVPPNCHRLFWIAGGGALFRIEGERQRVEPGSLVWLSAGQACDWQCAGEPNGFVLWIERGWLASAGSRLGEGAPPSFAAGLASHPVAAVPLAARAHIQLLGERIRREQAAPQAFCEGCCCACLQLLWIEYLRHVPARSESAAVSNRRGLALAFDQLLERHFRSKHRVSDYAALLNVSVSTLDQSVVEQTGVTPASRIRERRLRGAEQLLAGSDLSVSEIAYALGFGSPSSFGRFFRQYRHASPGRLRQERWSHATHSEN